MSDDWSQWHRELIACVNGQVRGKFWQVVAEFAHGPAVCRRVQQVSAEYCPEAWPKANAESLATLSIPPYTGDCDVALAIRELLDQYLADDLILACAHGSVGSNEVVPYSDFDGLVVLKNETIKNPDRLLRVARVLRKTHRLVYEHDPLQHHGWFVLPESALTGWPQAYLPVESLAQIQSLVGNSSSDVRVKLFQDAGAFRYQFESLCHAIEREIDTGRYCVNLYQLKSHLSKVMLLPCLFLQAYEGEGVNKRDSFEQARSMFSTQHWSVIDQASYLRATWKKPGIPLSPVGRRSGRIGDAVRKHRAPALFAEQKNIVSEKFTYNLHGLIESMHDQVEKRLNG